MVYGKHVMVLFSRMQTLSAFSFNYLLVISITQKFAQLVGKIIRLADSSILKNNH